MQKMTKTQLRKRWSDANFVDQLTIPRDRMPKPSELGGLDLRGVPKLANGEPFWHFAIRDAATQDIDLSFGDGCLIISGSSVSKLCLEEFRKGSDGVKRRI